MKTRKMVSLLTACLLLMSLFIAMPASAAENLFTHENVDFEKGTTAGWSKAKLSAWSDSISDEYHYSGDYSLKLSAETAASSAETYNYNGGFSGLTAGEEYIFSAMVNIPTALTGADGTIQLYVKTSTNAFGEKINVTSGWQKTELKFTAGTDHTFYIRLRSDTAGTVYIDDIALHSVKELEAEAAAEAALRFTSVSEYQTTFPMETGDNWSTAASASLTFDSGVKQQGLTSMAVTYPAGSTVTEYDTSYTSTKPSVEAGKTYEASVWINIPASENNVDSARLFIRLPDGSYLNTWKAVKTTNGEWKRISYVFTPTTGGAFKNLRVDIKTKGTGTATVYWDNFTLVEKTVQNPVLQVLDSNEWDISTPKAGEAFTVKYDIHKRDEKDGMTDKSLIAAIYKTVGGKKQLVEINVGSFGETDTAVSLPMTGIAASENAAAYSMKVMLWDSIAGMRNLKRANISFQ